MTIGILKKMICSLSDETIILTMDKYYGYHFPSEHPIEFVGKVLFKSYRDYVLDSDPAYHKRVTDPGYEVMPVVVMF